MAACEKCRVNHAPYSCEEYQRLRTGENTADATRSANLAATTGEGSCLLALLLLPFTIARAAIRHPRH